MNIFNCPKCGGTHYGSNECPFTTEDIKRMTSKPEIPKNEKKLEDAIQAKGLNAPRLSSTMISERIISEAFYVFPGTTMTICCLTLRNGYNVIGESAAASPENFDKAIGERVARDNARNKIWALEGYLLKSKLDGEIAETYKYK